MPKRRTCRGGRALIAALVAAGMTQRDVERDLDTATGLVSRWINGERVPDLQQAVWLRDRLSVPVEAWVVKQRAVAA